jgi:hypothetical protein
MFCPVGQKICVKFPTIKFNRNEKNKKKIHRKKKKAYFEEQMKQAKKNYMDKKREQKNVPIGR